jgi:hypothetical protein
MMQTPFARAQEDQGTIIGTVADTTGAVVANATVEVKDVNTGFTMTRKSNGSGTFALSPLKIGTYELRVSADGFETDLRSGLEVHAQGRLGVNIQLHVGASATTVTVAAQEAQMQTQDASVGQTLSAETIQETPLNGRNYVYIAQMTMGVAPANAGSRGAARGDFSANGQRAEQNNFILDGVDNNVNLADFLNGASYVIKPPPDALSEFSVQTSNFSAELGHDAGGVLSASIKSGTNALHGSLWEYFRNDKLNDTDWFSLKKPYYHQNQFGGTLGGPVLKNKLFLFGDMEANRVVYQRSGSFFTVPTALQHSSGFTDFTELLNPTLNGKVQTLYTAGGPATPGSTTSNTLACNGVQNTLCPGQVNVIAKSLLANYPLPNYGAVGQTTSNYLFPGKITDDTTQYDVRSDWNMSGADQAFARYSYSQEPQHYQSPLGPILDGGAFDADGLVATEGRNFTSSETHVFSQKLVNEARFGYNWVHATFRQENSGTSESSTYGIGGIPSGPLNGGLPYFNISGLSAAGSPRYTPSEEYENVAQFLDNITTTFRNHALKIGMNAQRILTSTLQPGQSRGNLVYNGMYSDDPAHTGTSGAGIVDFLMDNMQSATINNFYNTENQRWYDAIFLQDDWKLPRKLTLNLGIRWEYAQPYVERHGRQANFIPENYTPVAGVAGAPNYVQGGGEYDIPYKGSSYALPVGFLASLAKNNIALRYTSNDSLVNAPHLNFAPRFGFAYSPTDKLVIRGGYGIFFGGLESLGYGPNIGQNVPFAISDSIAQQTCSSPTNCTVPLTTLENGFAGLLQGNGALSTTNIVNPAVQSYGVSNKTPYTESYNLSMQYAISPTASVTVGYVGNVDLHLRISNGTTDTYDGLLAPGTSYNQYLPLGGGIPGIAGSSFGTYGLTSGRLVLDNGIGNYNALQSKFEKSTSKNLSFLATYTYSHALDDARPPLGSYSGQAGYRLIQWLGAHYDYGTDLSDVRQRATLNAHYALPLGSRQRFLNQAGVLNEIVGGWETSLIFRVQTGSPVDLVASNTLGNGISYPIQVANPFASAGTVQNTKLGCATATKTVTHWFNPCSFANPTSVTAANYNSLPLSSFYGNQGSTTVVGPGYNRVDMSLFKNFATLRESSLQFRADAFNLLNTPAHGQPAIQVAGGGGGINGQIQNGLFGQITNERFSGEQPDSRVIQFSMKLQF